MYLPADIQEFQRHYQTNFDPNRNASTMGATNYIKGSHFGQMVWTDHSERVLKARFFNRISLCIGDV